MKKTPINVKKNTATIYRVVDKFKKDERYKHINFRVEKSKSSNSIYIKLTTIIDGKVIRKNKRVSDHSKTGIKKGGEYLTVKKTEKDINQLIISLIKSLENRRLKALFKGL